MKRRSFFRSLLAGFIGVKIAPKISTLPELPFKAWTNFENQNVLDDIEFARSQYRGIRIGTTNYVKTNLGNIG